MADLITMLSAVAGQQGEEADEDFNQTVLLLHGDGTNGAQNNTFLDSSTNNFTITRNGNTTQGTFSPFSVAAGEWSNYFDGTGDYLNFADNAAFSVGSSNFTFEAWVYWIGSGTQTICGQIDNQGNTAISYLFRTNATDKLTGGVWVGGTSYIAASSASLGKNQWNHVAFVRDGNTTRLYINGVQDGTADVTGVTVTDSNQIFSIGRPGNYNGDYWTGYISNFRFVNGSCLYPGGTTFTPSTIPLTTTSQGASSSEVELLTCQSNRFVDNSTNAFAITRNGDVRVTPFSPFAPTAAYSASVNGGSGYFDGTGDYLNTPSSGQFAPTGDFTVAWWYYPTTLQFTVMIANYTGNNATDWSFETDSTGDFNVYLDGSTQRITGSTVIKLNQWNYLVVSRSSTTVTAYCNGSSVGTHTLSGTFGSASKAIRIGAGSAGTNNMVGYCAGVSLIDGTALDGTIPTAPPTDVSGTELLCNFTNAGIIDNTGKNNLETVGNAQIDTTTKKYGTGSMEFDGTGDWLLMPNTPDQQLGTGNFTIEFWVYLASGDTGSARGLVAKGTSTTGWLVSLDSSQKVVFTYTTSTITSSGAITLDAWNHIAVVREGTGSNQTKIYIGGTNDGTGTVSTNFNQTESMYVGANRTGGDPMKGFIDDLRITKGVARYTANFSVPGKAFPDL